MVLKVLYVSLRLRESEKVMVFDGEGVLPVSVTVAVSESEIDMLTVMEGVQLGLRDKENDPDKERVGILASDPLILEPEGVKLIDLSSERLRLGSDSVILGDGEIEVVLLRLRLSLAVTVSVGYVME